MTDIVERLREVAGRPDCTYGAAMDQAADEIERLRGGMLKMASARSQQIKTIERLRAALRGVIRVADRNTAEFNEARAALWDKP